MEYNPEKIDFPLWKLIDSKYPNLAGKECRVSGCDKTGKLTCTGCYAAAYCSRDHQKANWKSHKDICAPFKIVSKPDVGRHLVATRNLNPGDIIFQEYPIAVGPQQYIRPVCLGCHEGASLTGYRCSKCDWPMCKEECEKSSLHRAECSVFSQAKVKPTALKRRAKTDDNGNTDNEEEEIVEHPMYECITPLRVCLSAVYKPDNWGVVSNMLTHREKRQMDENNIHNQHNIVSFLSKYAKLNNHISNISEADITLANDVLDVNSFEIRGKCCSLRGLYPLTAMMNSTCTPNTQNSIDVDYCCTVRAIVPIKKGEEICDTYTSTLCNTIYRQKSLLKTKYFVCICPRCKDPYELESNFSSLKCRSPGCNGFMVSTNPIIDQKGEFRCSDCNLCMDRKDVESEQETWEQRVESCPKNVQAQESLLEELCKVYHPNHNMCMDVKFNLIPLYGAVKGDNMVSEAERKEKTCENILEVLDKVLPGLMRIRGMILVELYSTRLFRLRRALESGALTKPEFVSKLKKERHLLETSKTILSWEPVGSIESSRLRIVLSFLEQLDQISNQAGTILSNQ